MEQPNLTVSQRFFNWILSNPMTQWMTATLLTHFTGGWVFIRKDEPGWEAYQSQVPHSGDPSLPTTNLWTNRQSWKTCLVIEVRTGDEIYIGCDDVFGRRFVYMKATFKRGDLVALRIGHEPAVILALRYVPLWGKSDVNLRQVDIITVKDLHKKYPRALLL